jgi:flavin-dependent dehydrogenase
MTQILPPRFDASRTVADVFIIGGGPAGATAATLLAQHGRSVVLADKDQHPRFHIGESLLPASMRLFQRLGVAERLADIGVAKYAAEFVSQYHGRTETFAFARALDPSQPYSYQVPRAEFDHLLLQNAEEKGAAIHQGTRVQRAERDAATGLWTIDASCNGQARQWQAKFVLDASGRDTFFANQRQWKQKNPDHSSAALYAHYRGAARALGPSGGNIQLYWFAHGWFWAIPLPDGVTSIGAVCWPYYLKSRKVSVERFFADTIALAPDLAARLTGAERCTEITATGNYSYTCSNSHGEGFLLIGDAYSFIDPLFSTGVMLATESAALAADRVHQLLDAPHQARSLLAEHKAKIDQAMADFTWLIYRMPSPIMRDLMMRPDTEIAHPQAVLAKRAVISLLAGDVFSDTTQQMYRYFRTFKLVYWLSCLRQPLRWWRHRQHRKAFLSG